MEFFDLHCDTLYEIERKRERLYGNSCHVSLENAAQFENYAKIMAIWTSNAVFEDDDRLSYRKMYSGLLSSINDGAALCRTYSDMEKAREDLRVPLFLAVEDAHIIGNDMSRLETLYYDGVRFLTLMWKGVSNIGGAYDTDVGLTPFGREVVKMCCFLGIVVDISHASKKTSAEAIRICEAHGGKVVATHSNSFSVCPHARNLTDDEIKEICRLGGIIGVSFVPEHLRGARADMSDIKRHIERFVSLGAEKNLCIGSDFDGVKTLLDGIESEKDVKKLYDYLASGGCSRELLHGIFWQNACDFIKTM